MSRADDRKMKELADRLVAMSPEPPPYPEEVSVTQREDSKPRPVLVFAGAALVVLLLAAIPLFLSRGGGEVDPVASSTTSTVPTTVTTQPQASTTVTSEQPATTTTVPATTTTTASVVEAEEAVLYAVQTPENSFTGNPALVAFRGTVVPSRALRGADESGLPGFVCADIGEPLPPRWIQQHGSGRRRDPGCDSWRAHRHRGHERGVPRRIRLRSAWGLHHAQPDDLHGVGVR